jgi:hypothetical protein
LGKPKCLSVNESRTLARNADSKPDLPSLDNPSRDHARARRGLAVNY